MTHGSKLAPRPVAQTTARRVTPPHRRALHSAAANAIFLAVMAWPVARLWNQPDRDYEMLLPALGLEAALLAIAVASVVRFLVLRRQPYVTSIHLTPAPGRKPRSAEVVELRQRRTAPAPAPRRTAPSPEPRRTAPAPAPRRTAPAPVEQVDLELDAPEPFAFSDNFPDVPDSLGRPFQLIMAVVVGLAGRPDAVVALGEAYEHAIGDPRFADAEAFVVDKVEARSDYSPNIDGLSPLNVAVFMAQASELHPFAAVIAGMVLIAADLPEEVWDLLAEPWERAGLGLPEVALA